MVTDPRQKQDSLRYELKMACQASAYDKVRSSLELHTAGVREAYPPRQVQSIYFDTDLGRSLQDNLAGISRRHKLRFRWYHDVRDQVSGRLELKERENMLGWKYTLPIEGSVAVEGVDRETFTRDVKRRAGAGWQYLLNQGLSPSQWISYRREYFTTADRKVRVTLDRQLRCWDQRSRFRLSARFPTPSPDVLIVEAKCAPADYVEVESLVEGLPLFVDKCSKFVIGAGPSDGPMLSILP